MVNQTYEIVVLAIRVHKPEFMIINRSSVESADRSGLDILAVEREIKNLYKKINQGMNV